MVSQLRCVDDAPPPQTIRAMRDRIDLLEEENRQYREANENVPSFPNVWGLTKSESRVLARLARAKGNVVSGEGLLVALYGLEPDVDLKIVKVFICKIRKKLNGTNITIRTSWGAGYALSAEGVSELARLASARQDAETAAPTSERPDDATILAAPTARVAVLEAENARLTAAVAVAAADVVPDVRPQRQRRSWRDLAREKAARNPSRPGRKGR